MRYACFYFYCFSASAMSNRNMIMELSSDSEDDCYGNAANMLEKLKKKYQDENIKNISLLNDSVETPTKTNNVVKNSIQAKTDSTNSVCCISDDDDIELAKLLAMNNNTRVTRSAKRKSNIDLSILETSPSINKSRGTPKRGRRGGKNSQKASTVSSDIEIIPATRGKSRATRKRPRRVTGTNIPTISIGNTMDYPDNSEAQSLFSSNACNDIVIIDDNDLLDENEELFLKVYWQSSEIFKFNVRKYQKLKTIFRHFSEKENVSQSQLLFTYNDKILKPDDTPDSINYNIAKFIDGGIINKPVTIWTNKKHESEGGGIKIKFQCQNIKKPFETSIQVHDKLALAIMKCAEHFELPLKKLKFEFDGDNVLGSMTPEDLDLEGGECIDVKILK